ncbi:hypothetical protein [Clavibacter sp. Sh2088]|uniref:hypothetical protein n=1 Tax=Clavibacter sp. Sh2088 TaxID=3397676 RepID=UPI0039DF45D4
MVIHAPARQDRWADVSLVTGIVALGAYALLWCVMWIPYLLDGSGLMILYPLFLLAWVPLEALALVSLVFAIIALSLRQGRRGATIAVLVADAVFAVVSLPALWTGFPLYLFLPVPG